ncbi:MAG TPA: right-handed parallel beta-helix repeat-containing protein [Candidatus Saccharimonadales bacterium]|nr:right-handed parallel beta-helix repeat-containing protein [Candidatus Saccharimonadales bacterium]
MKRRAIILPIIGVLVLLIGVVTLFRLLPSNNGGLIQNQTDQTVALNIPESGLASAKQRGVIELSLTVSDATRIKHVEFLLDGVVVSRSSEPPYRVSIAISQLKPGQHTIQAIAYDFSGGSVKSDPFVFTIDEQKTVAPANDDSKEVVQQSSPFVIQGSGTGRRVFTTGYSNGSTDVQKETTPDAPGDNGGDGGTTVPPTPQRTDGGWWASLPETMKVCSNAVWNGGPAAASTGWVTVPAGDNVGFNFSQTDTVYWFAPGEHTLGTGEYSQITPGSGSTYIGAPGAILDGKNNNKYAFSGGAENVRIAYLEIRNFGHGLDNNNEGVINHDSGTNWKMEYLYAHNNDGAAVFIGSENTVQYSCLKDNGQYGFSMYKPQVEGDFAIKNIVLDNNEIVGNNQDDWESRIDGCGCTGGGKFWDVLGARVTNNYVHDNLSTGLWADTNDTDFLFDSNWVEHNSGEGIWYEISYNATISRNVLKRNAWATGTKNLGSPAPAIYISESGGDSRLPSSVSGSTNLQIKNNLLEDNFSGVSIFENANRFCNSNGNTSKTYCTPFVSPTIIPSPYNYTYPNPINSTHPCYTNILSEPYTTDCRWNAQNVQVSGNEFRFDKNVVPCAGTYCGVQALFATGDNNIPWAPAAYTVATVQDRVMFGANNKFFNNTYVGDWRFAKGYGEKIYYNEWNAAPFNQDQGSIFNGATAPPPVENALDADTATLEGSIGQWGGWYSADATQSTAEAHSGTHSLQIAVTGGGGWGVALNNYPGFPATAGPKKVSFWVKQGSGAIANATLRIRWRDGSDALLQTDTIPMTSLSTAWQQGLLNVTAPAGTAAVSLEVTGSSGSAGNTLYLDDFVVGDAV